MPNHPASPADIDAFVNRVIDWSKTLLKCADAAVARAHEQRLAGEIGFADFNAVLQNKIAVTQKCFEMTNSASAVLAKIAESELAPLAAATAQLQAASDKLDKISRAVAIISELVVAASAIAVAIAAPTPASIGAAGSAVVAVSKDIVSDADG
jgi:hypothetical protein